MRAMPQWQCAQIRLRASAGISPDFLLQRPTNSVGLVQRNVIQAVGFFKLPHAIWRTSATFHNQSCSRSRAIPLIQAVALEL